MTSTENIPRIKVVPRAELQKTLPLGNETGVTEDTQRVAVTRRYPIIEKIGDGGMGVVYLARDMQLDRFVAIKRLNQIALIRPAMKNRFFREAKAIAALNHSYIVHIYELGEDHEGPYIVMEYIPGPRSSSPDKEPPAPFTLADKVHRDGALGVENAIGLLLKLAHAVEYAHGCHIIHRDLKPSNVLLDGSENPKIVDFGLARTMDDAQNKLTVPGEKMLSLGYGAPEQEADASDTDERADVYGLGALLYFSLTGQNPRYYREKDVPEELRGILQRALETDRSKRWSSVAAFSEALMLVKAPTSIELPTTKTTWRCKWCDTINPVGIHFCASCGWDGGERCLECGAETRFGIRYCGSCGADARAYETTAALRDRLTHRFTEKDYSYVLQHAAQASAFRPVGLNGQALIAAVNELSERASERIRRRDELRDAISVDIERQNYERARRAIAEYRSIAEDNGYESELQQMDGLIRARDLARIRQALADGNTAYADLICSGFGEKDTDAELLKLRRRIRLRRRSRRQARAALALGAVAIGYLLSTAPAYRLLNEPGDREPLLFYQPAARLSQMGLIGVPVRAWGRLWGVHDLFLPSLATDAVAFTPAHVGPEPPDPQPEIVAVTPPETPETPPIRELSPLDQVSAMISAYKTTGTALDEQHARAVQAWAGAYLKQIRTLRDTVQAAGDLEGWILITEAIASFANNRITVADERTHLSELRDIQFAFQKDGEQLENAYDEAVLAEATKFVNELTILQRKLTKDNAIDAALQVHSTIREVDASDRVRNARKRQEARRRGGI